MQKEITLTLYLVVETDSDKTAKECGEELLSFIGNEITNADIELPAPFVRLDQHEVAECDVRDADESGPCAFCEAPNIETCKCDL